MKAIPAVLFVIFVFLFILTKCTDDAEKRELAESAAKAEADQVALYKSLGIRRPTDDGVLLIHRKAYYELIKKGVPPETAALQAPELYALCRSTGGGATCYSN